ncbi:MAG: SUMF1/EgtB/PvdO family nonheme iron enzyme [bacterium]|nr:SUMF1/EgtB/PvdO family nonheme iron enzyme [bacterium]
MSYAELEIDLHRSPAGGPQVELRFTDPESEADLPPERGTAALDFAVLAALDPDACGDALADALFHDENVRRLYDHARTTTRGRSLRLRLALPADAPELHAVAWELVHDPQTRTPLVTADNVLFSRFVRSRDWRRVELGPRGRLKALVAVAAPADLASYQLPAIDVDDELSRIRESLCPSGDEVAVEVVGRDEPLTLERLLAQLRGVDVLYLVCHGVVSCDQVPALFLQDEDGKVAPIETGKLTRAVGELRRPPRLVVFDSRSGGGTTVAAALAPRLAEAGVAAILTVPGGLLGRTAAAVLTVFFRELRRDGRIDRALAVARAVVRDRPDVRMPTLYLRLKRGCLWQETAMTWVFVCSVPEKLVPLREAACDVVRELGMEPLLRAPAGLAGFQPVPACIHQVGAADLVLAIVGHRRGEVPGAELGGDGTHPWAWWETRAAFERGRPVAVLMAADSWRPALREDDAHGRAVMRGFRGELRRLAAVFHDDGDGFRELVRRQLLSAGKVQPPADTKEDVRLRRWPPPKLPAEPYPLLLPYRHPELMAGRDRELAELRRGLARPVLIVGLHAPSGSGKSSLLAAGLVPALRAEGRPVAFDRRPCEPGIVRRLLGDLLDDEFMIGDDDPGAFADCLSTILRLADGPPVLVLDQFEDLLRRDSERRARAVVGTLLAASVQLLPGLREPPCRWLLAYRQEYHGEVFHWLGDVLRDARAEGRDPPLPHDLSGPDRFHAWSLCTLGTPPPGTGDRTEAAARIFQAAIEKPLALTSPEGEKLYPLRFTEDGAARLARAFGEARVARRNAPLTPELQVVLTHLLAGARKVDEDGLGIVEVPDDPRELIERALEEHLRRALDAAFPAGKRAGATLGRTRALLALRELADVRGRRDEGCLVETLARAIGADGRDVLEKLATPQTRLVLLERQADEQVYVLSHDRMAEVVVRLVDDERTYAGLGVDEELLGLRRFVALQRELFTSGEVEQSTEVPKSHFHGIESHRDALLWDDEGRRWWAVCRERQRRDRRRKALRHGIAAAVVVVLTLVVGILTKQYFERQALLETVAEGDYEAAFATLAELTAEADVDTEELLARVRQREKPFDVLDRGLGGVDEDGRGEALLRVVELLLLLQRRAEAPEDPDWVASMVWALDFFAVPDPALRRRAVALRDEILGPLRKSRPPPPLPGPDDSEWADIPAGTFMMRRGPGQGRGEQDKVDERPKHPVQLTGFRLMVHEVTMAEFHRLFPHVETIVRRNYPNLELEDDLPAFLMTWYEAYTYAAWLGGRLPTEAEWEYAARADCRYTLCKRDGSEAAVSEVAWWVGNSDDPETGEPTVKRVMQLEANPWGLHDVYGNVCDLTANWYYIYPEEHQTDPAGPTNSSHGYRMGRGASVFDPAKWIGASGRGGLFIGDRSSYGLRVALPEDLTGPLSP